MDEPRRSPVTSEEMIMELYPEFRDRLGLIVDVEKFVAAASNVLRIFGMGSEALRRLSDLDPEISQIVSDNIRKRIEAVLTKEEV